MKRFLFVLFALIVLVVGIWAGLRGWRSYRAANPLNAPPEQNINVSVNTNPNSSLNTNQAGSVNTNAAPKPLPSELNLPAPFTSQAPHANWDTDHEDFCEEASILMAAYALQDKSIANADAAEVELQRLKQYEMDEFGYFESTTAEQTAKMIRGVYSLKAELLENPTPIDLKQELAAGHYIVVPAAGRELGNPNFRDPGPLYHMLLLKGYTSRGEFVTNDPGTRNGRNYVYKESVLMDAIHDWNDGDVNNGQSVVIVVTKET